MWSMIGNELAVERLKTALAKGNLGHAYLISGLPHIGKMTLALTLAQALSCRQMEAPCGNCLVCQRIIALSHPDVQVVALGTVSSDDKSHSRMEISIKQVRDDIQHWVNLPSFEGGYRVFIIDDAERLSPEAANCLLKTLEEPQEKVLFLLLSSDSSRLPETVISRCQRIDLKSVAATKIEMALLARGSTDKDALLLSRLSRGCPGWALAAVFNDSVSEHRVERLKCLFEILTGNLEMRFEYAAELATRFTQKRAEVQEILNSWLEIWRDLLMLKAGIESEIINLDYLDRLQVLASGFNINEIRRGTAVVSAALKQLWQNASPRLVLEVMMLDMPVASLKRIKV